MNSLLTVLVAQSVIHPSLTEDPWYGGDWVLESLRATEEPIGVEGEWSDYVNTLAWEYEEDPSKQTTAKSEFNDDGLYEEAPDWKPLSPYDLPYLAVIYRRDHGRPSEMYKTLFGQEPDPGGSHIEPGTACGGALLTSKYVLSVCGCLMTLISEMQGVLPAPLQPGYKSYYPSYDIYDLEVGEVPQIYVDSAIARFTPTFRHAVVTDPAKWSHFETLNCKGRLKELKKYSYYDVGKKATILNGEMVVIPFTPAMKPEWPSFFPQWPPHPIDRVNDKQYQERVHLISIGMKQSKKFDFKFFSSISASAVEMKHCGCRSIVCNATQLPLVTQHTCFQAFHDFSLSGGTIGWPVVWKGKLVGLTGSIRDSKDSTVRVNLLHSTKIRRIEDFVSLKVLEDQNTPPSVYREADLANKYMIYDYHRMGDIRPKSMSSINGQSAFACCFTIVAWFNGNF